MVSVNLYNTHSGKTEINLSLDNMGEKDHVLFLESVILYSSWMNSNKSV